LKPGIKQASKFTAAGCNDQPCSSTKQVKARRPEMAGKINIKSLHSAIQAAVKGAHSTLPHEELIMGFVAPENIAEKQAETIANEITQKIAPPGAQPFVGPQAPAGGGAQALALRPGRILGFRAAPKVLE